MGDVKEEAADLTLLIQMLFLDAALKMENLGNCDVAAFLFPCN